MKETDIVIIGAGPVGLFSVFQAGMLKMKCVVVDTLEHAGGQCIALYPEKPIYDIPAFPKIVASDLIDQLEEQIKPFSPEFYLNQRVDKVEKQSDKSFIVTTSKNIKFHCKAIIIAAGCGAFGFNRPPLKNIEEFEGKSVFYAVKSKGIFTDKNVVIAGGGDSAVDWALSLAEIANKVFVVHRRDKFRCSPESADQLKKLTEDGKVELVIPYQLEAIEGSSGVLNKVVVKDFSGNLKEIYADYLLPFFGLATDLGPIADWGLELDKHHIKVNQENMQTSAEAIYAIGDIATYKNKLKLILTGFAESATACHDIYKIVFPDQILHFEHSTSKGVSS